MAMKLYVGGLPYTTTEDELRELASAYGEVTSAIIIIDKFTDRSKGFGFVEFDDDAAGQAAVSGMNDSEVGGRKITVNEARPPKPREDRGGYDRR